MTLPDLSWKHVVALLIAAAGIFFALWQAPLATALFAWVIREALDSKVRKLKGRIR